MSEIYIICVEDEPYVLDVVIRDLAELEDLFPIEVANSAKDARQIIKEIREAGNRIGLAICDHIMPGDKGVDLMIEMQNDPFTEHTRKVLLTGQAGLEETVEAVNKAKLNHYIGKPWKPEELLNVAKDELTSYVIKHEEDLIRYMKVLDAARLQEVIREKGYI
jgi:response regulator RpfG family c-di-GMP phosphodiesterase